MAVLRIVPNLQADIVGDAARFYRDILKLDVVMDQGWIVTYSTDSVMQPQVSIVNCGGSGAPVPDISVEVDNLDEVYSEVKSARLTILYDLTEEPWGVRRFIIRDPIGKVVNILEHL